MATQPLPSVPVTVYVVVVEDGGTNEALLLIVFPEASTPDQLYVEAPVPVIVTDVPSQTDTSEPALTVGKSCTVTATSNGDDSQPFALVCVTR